MRKIALILASIILLSILGTGVIYSLNNGDSNEVEINPDIDGDGLTNKIESEIGTDPWDIDSDNDGMDDKEEYDYWTSRFENSSDERFAPDGDIDGDGEINIIDSDSDNDDILDGYELEYETDPADSDTDDDGLFDGEEILIGSNPTKTDTDGDNVNDGSDINPLVDLSIGIQLTKFKVSSKVDILRWAQVYFDIKINDEKVKRLDNNGRKWWVWLKTIKEIEHDTISYDIPDDTKEQSTTIEIIMYDYDLLGSDDVIDISPGSGNSLIINLDHKTNTLSNNEIIAGEKGTVWYEIELAEPITPEIETYKVDYQWNFRGRKWDLTLEIPVETYKEYLDSTVNRIPQSLFQSSKKMADFVTSTEMVIIDLKNNLLSIAESKNFDQFKTANFILKFVQYNVEYALDNDSKGCVEYWKFPVETLVEKEGDCEDSSVLFAAIMDSLGYEVVLFFYSWEENDEKLGHLAVGINLDVEYGDFIEHNGKKYYYCETTNIQYTVGKIPKDFEEKPRKIINI